MKMPTRFSKLFEALDTALTDRYRHNPYVRSTVNIILLQVALTVVIVSVFGHALRYQQAYTLTIIDEKVEQAVRQDTLLGPLDEDLKHVQNVTLQYAFLGLVLLTALFGYLTARYALKPTRNSLQFQKRFIGNMAHEIRTPLAIIKTNTEVALMDPDLSPTARETLETTSQELDRISEIINNLLSFDTLVRPSRVAMKPLDIAELAEAVVKRHRALAQSRGIELVCQSDGALHVLGNLTGIEQVLTNLVKNALNYTPQHEGGQVTVTVRDKGDEVLVSVADTGIGIAKKDLYYIFQPFYRADTSRARGVGGGSSGLGLAIVNEIVRAHNGKIFVRSTLNRGTTIEVSFPKMREAEGAQPVEPDSETNEYVVT